MSQYCSNIGDKYQIKFGGVRKLVPNLGNKSKYVVQYKNLQLYLSLEVKLTKVHRVLKFKQSDWLKNMLILIQKKVNSFEKDLIKLMINSVYDKTMYNLWKRMNVWLVNSAKHYTKYTSKLSFVS